VTVSSKAESLLGFAIKAGRVIFGADNIVAAKKTYLILICKGLSENSVKKLLRQDAQILISNKPLEEVLHRPGCKSAAVTDKEMARAILQNSDNNFTRQTGGKS